jgi:hypothetical protein
MHPDSRGSGDSEALVLQDELGLGGGVGDVLACQFRGLPFMTSWLYAAVASFSRFARW